MQSQLDTLYKRLTRLINTQLDDEIVNIIVCELTSTHQLETIPDHVLINRYEELKQWFPAFVTNTTHFHIPKTLYDEDFYLWTETTANQIRNRDFKAIDWEHLLEEVEALGSEQKHKVESYLRQLLKHLLLYQYWKSEKVYCSRGWSEEIDNFRNELEVLLRSQTLYNYLVSIVEPTYQKARRSASIKSDLKIFPTECVYIVEKILDPNWLLQ